MTRLLSSKAAQMRRTLGAAVGAVLMLALAGCGDADSTRVYTGYAEADLVYVAAPASGWLVDAPFTEGARVSAGDMVFSLDDDLQSAAVDEARARLMQAEAQLEDLRKGVRTTELQAFEAQLAEAQADLRLARAERDRSQALVQRGVASKARGDEADARYGVSLARVKTAKANLETARLSARDDAIMAAVAARDAAADTVEQASWHRDQRQVIARTDGVVEDVFHRTGEFVPVGSPVIALLPDTGIKVRFFVPQHDLPSVSLGMEVTVTADGREGLKARISHIAREAEFTPPVIYSEESRDTLVFLVEALPVAPQALRPGQPVDVRLP